MPFLKLMLVFSEQRVHEKTAPLSIMVQYSKYLANIIEIFTTEFSAYLYIVCKNSWKFNVKITFYYLFSITRSKHKFPWQQRLMHVHSYLQWSSVIIWRRTLIKTRSLILNTVCVLPVRHCVDADVS